MADEQSAAIAEAHVHDAELIALAGRMGLHSLDIEQLRALAVAGASEIPTEVWDNLRAQTKLTVGPWREPQPVTDEMLLAAEAAESDMAPEFEPSEYFTAIYRAMAALAPVELVTARRRHPTWGTAS